MVTDEIPEGHPDGVLAALPEDQSRSAVNFRDPAFGSRDEDGTGQGVHEGMEHPKLLLPPFELGYVPEYSPGRYRVAILTPAVDAPLQKDPAPVAGDIGGPEP